MPTIEVTDQELARVQQFVNYERMTPEQKAVERQRLRDAANEAALARLTPEQRAIAEQRQAEQAAKNAAENARVTALKPEEREAEYALVAKAKAERTLADPKVAAVVAKVSADPVVVDRLDALKPNK